jgi:hypothetical protein
MSNKVSITVDIENITPAQVEALQDMFRTWEVLGGMGSSRWTAFYADGDGNFRPKIKVNGKPVLYSKYVETTDTWRKDKLIAQAFEHGSAYAIDFDWVAWKMRKDILKDPTKPFEVPK